jgi:phosphate-selective porin OprO/OprP
MPMVADSVGTLLRVGLNFRVGEADDDSLQVRSRPEVFVAPYFPDTGVFPADWAWAAGPEIYYRPGRLLIGGEYFVQHVASPETGNPWFHGGEAFVSWLVTGETRAYVPEAGYFRAVSPEKTVVQGGPGAWEVVVRITYADFDDDPIEGGRYWRFTPMVNWHLTDNVRLEIAYGTALLEREGFDGRTRFMHGRIQMQL